ncbi:MAG: DUF5050 domain-containing protein [Lachnospiraceae bacterium]|nr:DUF5050 domain-containing protein [Lachnospiraceae bacterium]
MSRLSRNIISIAVALLFMAGILFYGITRHSSSMVPDNTIGNTAGNLTSGGLFSEAGGKVYFANPYDENCLYSMDPDGTHIKKLCNLSAAYINAGGDLVFFYGARVGTSKGLGSVAGKPGIFSVRSDGSHLSQLTSNIPMSMFLVGNNIYYKHAGADAITFDVFDLKKKESTELLPHPISAYSYDRGKLYYGGETGERFLYTFDTGLRVEEAIWQGDVWAPVYYAGYVYYLDVQNNYRICRYSPEYNQIEVLTNDRADFFNIFGNVIFYQKSSQTSPALKKMALDGAENMVVAEGTYNMVSLTSEYAYFTEFGHTTPLYRTPTYGYPNVTEFTEARDAALEAIRPGK